MLRKKTKTVKIGSVLIGGGNPIAVQSMTRTFTKEKSATIKQILSLEKADCDIIRVAVPGKEDAKAIKAIKRRINIPLVADIHFNYRLAIMAIESGADKIRINPGTIGSKDNLKEIVSACKDRSIPIRVGVNSGSLEEDLLGKYGHLSGKALVESALRNIKALEGLGFSDIVVSVKSTSVPATISAYRELSQKVDYPLHIGITEAGIGRSGLVRSSVGIGALLSEGIGDTIRVSLTGNPLEEVIVGHYILKSLELKRSGVTIISCPTCGRCRINVEKIAMSIEERTKGIKMPLTVAVMGCAVNGPGEAKEADVGVAGGMKEGIIFRRGSPVKRVPERMIIKALLDEIKMLEGSND